MAAQGFKGLGWFLCVMVVAPACYMVNSHGAAERGKLESMKAAIITAQKDIRHLEGEFTARSSFAQLQRWNGEVLAMAAPMPNQYLASEAQLADLDKPAEVQMASTVVPAPARVELPAAVVVAAAAVPVAKVAAEKSAAEQDKELRSLMKKADKRAVAMVENSLLSASTMNDIEKLAKREKMALR